jgi:hypothetical protein
MKAIKDAHKASENLGKAYNGEKMAPAHRLANKKVANAISKLGI